MRIRIGPAPEDPDFDPERDGWTRLREPRPSVLLAVAIPLGILLGGLAALAWSPIVPIEAPGADLSLSVSVPGLLGVLAALVGFMALHEALHALPVLLGGSREDITVGFWPRHLAPYVSYVGELSRRTQLLSGVTPFVLLTLVPVVVALVAPDTARWMRGLSVLNCLGSSADVILLALIARQVPKNAVTRSQGFATWWRATT